MTAPDSRGRGSSSFCTTLLDEHQGCYDLLANARTTRTIGESVTMSKPAIVGSGQRRVAIDVALRNGVTRDQYRTVLELVKTHSASRYGDWAAIRVMSVKRQFREGSITGNNVNAVIRYLRSCTVDGTIVDRVHLQVTDMTQLLTRVSQQEDTLNTMQRHHLNFAAQHLMAIFTDDD